MASYTVHLPAAGSDTLMKARFVRDGFARWGFVFGPFWLITQGAWISGLIVLALHLAFGLLIFALKLPDWTGSLGFMLIQFLVALEGPSFIRWELGLKGWREAGLVTGEDVDALEQRFFAEQLGETAPALPKDPGIPPLAAAPARASAPATSVLGLFPGAPAGPTRAGH